MAFVAIRTELLCYLVVDQLVALARTGEWLLTGPSRRVRPHVDGLGALTPLLNSASKGVSVKAVNGMEN